MKPEEPMKEHIETVRKALSRNCTRCRGVGRVSVKHGTTFDTDSASERAEAWHTEPCPTCQTPALDALAKIEAEHERVSEPEGWQKVADHCLRVLEHAGFGMNGRPNTIWGMIDEMAAEHAQRKQENYALRARVEQLTVENRLSVGIDSKLLLQPLAVVLGLAGSALAAPEQKCSTCGASKADGLTCSDSFHLECEYRDGVRVEQKEQPANCGSILSPGDPSLCQNDPCACLVAEQKEPAQPEPRKLELTAGPFRGPKRGLPIAHREPAQPPLPTIATVTAVRRFALLSLAERERIIREVGITVQRDPIAQSESDYLCDVIRVARSTGKLAALLSRIPEGE